MNVEKALVTVVSSGGRTFWAEGPSKDKVPVVGKTLAYLGVSKKDGWVEW